MKELKSTIDKIIKRKNRTWGIYAEDLDTKEKFTLNADKQFESASSIKVLILLALFKKLQEQNSGLKSPIKIKKEHIGKGSGLLQYFYRTHPLTLYNVALLMIIVSDNVSTNTLIDLLGIDYINRYIKSIGWKKTRLLTNKIDFPTGYKLKNTKIGFTTPYEIAMTLRKLVENKLFDEKTTKMILKIFSEQQFSKINRYLPTYNNLGDKRRKIKKFYGKTGGIVYENDNFFGVSNEVALIQTKGGRQYLFSIYSEGEHDTNHLYSYDSWVSKQFGDVSLALYNYFESKRR